jgi:hypothetical protein
MDMLSAVLAKAYSSWLNNYNFKGLRGLLAKSVVEMTEQVALSNDFCSRKA